MRLLEKLDVDVFNNKPDATIFMDKGDPTIPSPASDPTNPYSQERTGHWVANQRASDRRNSEPGMTERERKRRKY